MQLFNDFCNYTLDENGVLNSFQLDYPENYNFGYDVVDKMGELAPNDIAMEWTNPDHLHKTFTFADIKRLSNKAANAFKNQGVKKGDRVIVILKRNYEYWYIVPALHKLGAIVIPATQQIYLDALRSGLLETFVEAGMVVSAPTCGPCLGGHMGILAPGERAVSTTNRNFVGRMGDVTSEVYLASPAIAAASALTGYISDVQE